MNIISRLIRVSALRLPVSPSPRLPISPSPRLPFSSSLFLFLSLFITLLCGSQQAKAAAPHPELTVTSTVTDVNGGTLLSNEVLEYTYTITNIGDDNATVVALNNVTPTNTGYVSGSTTIDGVSKTDGLLDDQVDYVGLTRQLTIRLGSGASFLTGGTLAPNASTIVKFRVRINFGTAVGTAISNQSTASYGGVLLIDGGSVNSDASAAIPGAQPNVVYVNSSSTPATAPNIQLVHAVLPGGTYQAPKTDLTYSSTFTNSGGSQAQNFALTEPVPANTIFKLSSATASLGTTGLSVTILYSNNNGTSYTYTPVSGGGGAQSGYDASVTNIRYAFTGLLSRTAPNNTGSVSFVAQIQ